jgi:hypothetical protein
VSYSFPKNQQNGTEVELENGVIYVYNSTKKSWEITSPEPEESSGGLFTLSSAGNNFFWDPYVNTNQFTTAEMSIATNNLWHLYAEMSIATNNLWHLYNLKDDRGANAYVKDYLPTPDTVWEVWDKSTLRLKTSIKNWATSRKGSSYIEFNCSGIKPTVAPTSASEQYRTNYPYQLFLTNLKKKV